MCQVAFNSLLYLQRYAPNKLFIAKIKKESNSVNISDMVMVLAFYPFPLQPTISVPSFYKLPAILLEICSGQAFHCKKRRAVTP